MSRVVIRHSCVQMEPTERPAVRRVKEAGVRDGYMITTVTRGALSGAEITLVEPALACTSEGMSR